MEAVLAFVQPHLLSLAEQHPWVLAVLVVMASLRLFFKPVMTIIQNAIALSPSKKDDEVLAKIMDHKAYEILVFLIDWFASIKLPKKEESSEK